MFGKRITLFKLFGFEVHIDLSWLVLALLVTWSLASGVFPHYYEGLSPAVYWWMGAAGAAGLFLSIVFHELFHSLVARRFGLPMKGITLFIFGGVAEMSDEPSSPKVEFLMAIVGPLSSIALGLVFYTAAAAIGESAATLPIAAVLGYLATINWILAGFNLVPAFPLDGGRVLRSILWAWKKNLRKATRIASWVGSAFAFLLIFLGILNLFRGNFIGGLWQLMIGMFLRSAAEMSYRQVLIRRALGGETVSRFMNRRPVSAPPSISIREFVDDFVYHHHFKFFPVMDGDRLVGCIATRRIKDLPKEEWDRRTVGELADRCSGRNTVSPETDALKALALMGGTAGSRLMVVDNGRLVGIVSLRDIMGYLSVRMDLGEEEN